MSKKLRVKKQDGVTLIALVVTIVVLIILATASMNAVFSDTGILRQSQIEKDISANIAAHEDEMLNQTLGQYANSMVNTEVATGIEPYIDNVLVKAPKIDEGAMIPVKRSGDNWIKTTVSDEEWYNYAEKRWANVVLKDATIDETSGILNEDEPYTMLVWIPRFAYKIESGWNQDSTELLGSAGTINIAFINTKNEDRNGTAYNASYATATVDSITTNAMSTYVQHPAFTYGENEIDGFWIGKYESSNTEGITGYNSTNEYTLQIKANVSSWRDINISNIHTVCTSLNKIGNIYGLNTDDAKVDPHMIKNTEWGAVAYLSRSIYGNEEEIWNNSNNSYLTGYAGGTVNASNEDTNSEYTYSTNTGVKASTTGNIYGVYDMSGCTYEYVAAYVNNVDYIQANTTDQYIFAQNLITANVRYRDVYTQGTTDTRADNFIANSGKYGDAIYEISSNGANNASSSSISSSVSI